jgi:DNA-binding IclR family transcriptional regulator
MGDRMATPKNHSVQKAFAILRQFRSRDECLTSAELSRRAGLPEASGHRLITTLTELGAIVRTPNGKCRLGMLLLSLSNNVATRELLPQASHSILCGLAERLNLIVHMGVLENDMVTYVAKVGESRRLSVHTQVGTQLEAYCSGLGKVLLAALPKSAFDAFLHDGDFVALTPHTITDKAEFRKEIARVREQGYAIDDREISETLRCVAVPVRDAFGVVVAAISVSDDAESMDVYRQAEVSDALRAAAQAITRTVYPSAVEGNDDRNPNRCAKSSFGIFVSQ